MVKLLLKIAGFIVGKTVGRLYFIVVNFLDDICSVSNTYRKLRGGLWESWYYEYLEGACWYRVKSFGKTPKSATFPPEFQEDHTRNRSFSCPKCTRYLSNSPCNAISITSRREIAKYTCCYCMAVSYWDTTPPVYLLIDIKTVVFQADIHKPATGIEVIITLSSGDVIQGFYNAHHSYWLGRISGSVHKITDKVSEWRVMLQEEKEV